jgi:hypothetical protein
MTHPVAALFMLALVGTVFMKPDARRTLVVMVCLAGLVLSLAAQSPTRPVGDSREYVLMSINLARFEPPSARPEELNQIPALFPGVTAEGLALPHLRAPDGRQDFPHFWFYSLIAAPFVGAARLVGLHPASGFTAFNILLLLGVALVVLDKTSPSVALLVVAGPILWWVDKAHTEVLTVSMITVGVTLLTSRPWWSIAAFGVAATQNPPLVGAMAIVLGFAIYTRGWRDRRVWAAAAAGTILAALHPFYFYSRLRIWSGLYESVDRHWPSWRELMAVAFDPNLGVFVHDPVLLLAMLISAVEAISRPRRDADKRAGGAAEQWSLSLIALLFLASFTQTANFNSGGTPSMSRYGLWLVPFAIPVLRRVPEQARWLKVLAAGSVVWCVWAFSPMLPDRYLQPSALAADLWRQRPEIDNPLAEVFAERTAGHEPARPPVATQGCEKVLLWSDGSQAEWPLRCTSVTLPDFCQAKDALCYANRVSGGYQFIQAPSPPAWRKGITRQDAIQLTGGMLAITQSAEPRISMAIWHDDGWSYPERLLEPAPDVVSREWRWMGDRAAVGVMSVEPVQARMKIVARALGMPRRVRVSIGDVEIATLLVSPNRGEHQTGRFDLPAGSSVISLASLDGTDSPGTGDPRRLSIAVYRLELVATRP